ncbi:D-threo-aldose 1-dehydrogenase [Nonomuraea solani]|uniref:D-threo-aldose 1-dehydrogenase n=1 Tax=Nonomuraea solani TaxID=1144553 RepID=A0A1H6EQ02_9ACTN|nr:aldo/keto reductase [Nonomuraea solani]SEG99950.1 D-threo-aldose 1-dehydrogenase [Nonomuraea solani]
MPEQQGRRVPGMEGPMEAVTLGTSGLGRNPGDEQLADALMTGRFRQIDTSNEYAGGRSETLIGQAYAKAREGVTIFTKADRDPETGVFDGDRVLRSFEETITRLGVETLPIYHLHDPFTITVAEAMAPGGAVPALVSLREQGLVGGIGIAAADDGTLVEDYIRTDAFDAVLTHNRYTLVDRRAEEILRLATERDMTVFNAAPFGGGILSGSPRHATRYGYRPISPEFARHVERVGELCERWGIGIAAAALHFSLAEPRVHSTVVGISSLERLATLADLVDTEIPDGFWTGLEALGTPPPSTG